MLKSSLIALLLALCASSAWAGSFTVNPVRLDLSKEQPTTSVEITNTGKQPTVIQAVLKAWSQKDGRNVYSSTRALLATPPIFDIAPNDNQVVRVGLLGSPDNREEKAYRLFLTEVPPKSHGDFRGLQVALRVSIPIFIAPLSGKPTPKLTWRFQQTGPGKFEVITDNTGTAHARITDLELSAVSGGKVLTKVRTDNGYVLAGTQHVWHVDTRIGLIKQGQVLFLRGKTTKGSFSIQLPWEH